MKYTKTEQRNGYQLITTVDDKGNYSIYIKWENSPPELQVKTTIFEMGWRSVAEFLRVRRGFKKEVEQGNPARP